MNSIGSLPEQVHALRQQVSALEISNSRILKLLNERESSEKLVEQKWTDAQNKLETLEKRVQVSNGELRGLRENLLRLEGRVEELSRIIHGTKQKHRTEQIEADRNGDKRRPSQPSNGPTITIRKIEGLGERRNGSRSEAAPPMKTASKLEESGSNVENNSKQEDNKNVSSKRVTKQERTISKPPIKSDHLGLRGRTISFESDNRVRLLQGASVENGDLTGQKSRSSPQNTNSKDEDKWNLPTREQLRQKKIEEAKREGASSQSALQRKFGTKNEYKNLAGVNKDPDATRALVDMETWKNMADVERLVGLGKKTKQGIGPDTCLLLDTSGSMEGTNFEEMITIAKTFIQGIADYATAPDPSENIGIATFGEQTRVVHHLTNDYSKLLETLDLLSPAGPSPMSAGLYMALACCLGRAEHTTIHMIPVPFRVILISDGKGTPDIVSSGEDDFPVNLETTVMKHIWLNETITHFEKRGGVVYCVGVGDTQTEMMEELCNKTHGKMYSPGEVHKLIHMTDNTTKAIGLLDRNVDFENINELGKMKLRLLGIPESDVDEVVRLGEYYQEQTKESHYFREFRDVDMPPVGARVRRGPDWKYENQDQNGPGTIVAHTGFTSVCVVWDCENTNRYQCSPETAIEVLVVDEPRILKDQLIAVGCLVVRGEHWRYDDQDGGVGNVGVVLDVLESGLTLVRWPSTHKKLYKYGSEGFFEVKLCDPKTVKGTVGQLKTHVWGSGNVLDAPLNEASEGATAIIPTTTKSTSKEQIIEDKDKPKQKSLDSSNKEWTIEDMNKRNDQLRKTKTIESDDQAVKSSKPNKQMIVHWAYKKEDSWSEIPMEISLKMEKAYGRNKQGSIIVELEGNIWKANFSDMKMKCGKTRTVMDIQRKEASE